MTFYIYSVDEITYEENIDEDVLEEVDNLADIAGTFEDCTKQVGSDKCRKKIPYLHHQRPGRIKKASRRNQI